MGSKISSGGGGGGGAVSSVNGLTGAVVTKKVIRLDQQFDSTTNTLAVITGSNAAHTFSFAMAAGSEWKFRALLLLTIDATGLAEVAIDTSDTLTATNINSQVYFQRSSSSTSWVGGAITSLGGHVQASSNLQTTCTIEGTIKVNAAGTFVVQFCQSAGPSGTSSVQVGSYIEFTPHG